MSLKIYYTPHSKETLTAIYEFVFYKFGENPANKFVAQAEKTILLIAKQPFMFKSTDIDKNVRVATLNKQCSLFYKVTETTLVLLFFWDNRQEPLLSY